MFIRSRFVFQFATLLTLSAAALFAQSPNQPKAISMVLPHDSPVLMVSFAVDDASTPRGGAMLLNLHASLTLRNAGAQRIRGITFIVRAQDVTPGGKASVAVPSLDVAPGEVFPVQFDLRLLRPLQAASGGPMVQVGLDGVLFDDLHFYGPNQLNSRRTMTVWEMEARRDRRYFKALLEKGGTSALQQEMVASLGRQDRPQTGMLMTRGRATNVDAEHQVEFAFLQLPDSPVQPTGGTARIISNEARAPRFEVKNTSGRAVRYMEIGWILKDNQGREFLAGSMPADMSLAPGEKKMISQDASLKFPERAGIASMTGFVDNVEYGDGNVWIPSRTALASLQNIVAPSPEEQRLVQIYRKKGLSGLVEELKKF